MWSNFEKTCGVHRGMVIGSSSDLLIQTTGNSQTGVLTVTDQYLNSKVSLQQDHGFGIV